MDNLEFRCVLNSNDYLRAADDESKTAPGLFFDTNFEGGSPQVKLDTLRVRQLHSALGAWLSENGITQERTPEPALHVEERVTAGDVRRIAADEVMKLLLSGAAVDRMRALMQEEVQRNEADRRNTMREIAQSTLRNFLTRAIETGADR